MLKHCWIRIVTCLSLCGMFLSLPAESSADFYADPDYVIDVWPGGEGLPQSSVISIVQSRNGYLWLGTLNGLARFDGLRFKVFREGDLPGLNGNWVLYLFEDSHTNLWIGTASESVVYLKPDGSVQKVEVASGKTGREGRLMAACEDSTGTIWLYMADGRLFRYREGRATQLNGLGGASNTRVMAAEKNGPVWLGTDEGLVALNPAANFAANLLPVQQIVPGKVDFVLASQSAGHWRMMNRRVEKWNGNRLEFDLLNYPTNVQRIHTACEDRDGKIIVGTHNQGIYWYAHPWQPRRISSEDGLSHNTVLSLCMDREGALWVGTDGGGLNRIKPRLFRVIEGSQGLVIQTVCDDREGGVWYANIGGKLTHWQGNITRDYGAADGLLDLNVRSVFVDRDKRLWVGTTFGGLFQFQDDRFNQVTNLAGLNQTVSAIHQDRKGRLWFGTAGGLACLEGETWTLYTRNDGLSSDYVKALADDAEGNLWIGTEGGGLNRFRDGKVTVFRQKEGGLPSDNISSVWVDAENVVWVGTSAGLARLSGEQWTRYTKEKGLLRDGINYLLEDEQSLWAGTYDGLMRLSKKSLNDFAAGKAASIHSRLYGKADGVATPECSQGSQPAACRTADGRLWFATTRGLLTVNPSEIRLNAFLPPVKIESVLVDARPQGTNELSTVVVPPGKERLEIHYTSLNLGSADRARFMYKLEGHETDWTEVGDDRVARFSNLPPGTFTFRVRAANEDGVWNETGTALQVIVQPPFWRTGWFMALMTVAALGLVVALVHTISTQKLHRELAVMKQQEALEQERARIARDLHDQLGANLMQVALLGDLAESDRHEPAQVEGHAKQISQTARETTKALDEIVWAVNPSNDTLDGLITYLCKYAQEYFELAGLRYRLDVPAQLPEVTVPPEVRHNVFLAAKEAINNIVKHAQAAAAWIRLKLEPDRFTLEIEDNGNGLPNLNGKLDRSGLRNMRRRMEDVGGSFSIGPASGHGTLVRLTAPMGTH